MYGMVEINEQEQKKEEKHNRPVSNRHEKYLVEV